MQSSHPNRLPLDLSTPKLPDYPVTLWEALAITIGAFALVAVGAIGLVYKFFDNASNPQRATAIADSLMQYRLPGKVQGVFGTNIGGGKVAIVSTSTFPRDVSELPNSPETLTGVELFLAKVPPDIETDEFKKQQNSRPYDYDFLRNQDFSLSYRSGNDFQANQERSQNSWFCGVPTTIRIQDGNLFLSPDSAPLAAVKYEATALLSNSRRLATIVAIGRDADRQAAQVFKSLKCKS